MDQIRGRWLPDCGHDPWLHNPARFVRLSVRPPSALCSRFCSPMKYHGLTALRGRLGLRAEPHISGLCKIKGGSQWLSLA